MIDRRQFARIVYQAPATIAQGDYRLESCVLDLSLHGLLLWAVDKPDIDPARLVNVAFLLSGSDIEIALSARLVDVNERIVRLQIAHIDLDSVCHLKRLIELHVGNEQLLQRDIAHLADLAKYAQ